MIETFIDKKEGGADQTYINSLLRFARSGSIVPSQANAVVKIPAATATNPGMSLPIPLEGPQDANTELRSLTAAQGLNLYGMGTISSSGGPPGTTITGLGTKFLTQVQVGDTIKEPAGHSNTVASIQSDTVLTVTGGFNPNITNVNYVINTAIIADVQNRLLCVISDVSNRRDLMNAPCSVLHVFGDNQKPSHLCETLLLQKNQVVRFQFYNNSTAGGASIGFAAEGNKWEIEGYDQFPEVADYVKFLNNRGIMLYPYWFTFDQNPYPNNLVTIPSGGSTKAYMTNTGDVYLFLFYAYGHAVTTANGGETTEVFEFQIYDGETNRPYSSRAPTLNTGLGTAQNPYRFPQPIIVKPRNQLRIDLKAIATGASIDVYMTFGGVAMMKRSGAAMDPVLLKEAQRIFAATDPSLIRSDVQ